jgi:hypothetical protein
MNFWDIPEIVESQLKAGKIADRLLSFKVEKKGLISSDGYRAPKRE